MFMERFLNSKEGTVVTSCVIALVAVGMIFGAFVLYENQADAFQDVTVELGQPMPELEAFLVEGMDLRLAKMITAESALDLQKPGTHSVELEYSGRRQTVQLKVQDTTAPEVVFGAVRSSIGDTPAPEDFVTSVTELDTYTVTFQEAPVCPDTFGDVTVQVLVTDASGNVTAGNCSLTWLWMKTEYTMELGDVLEKADVLGNPEVHSEYLQQSMLDTLNQAPVGEYTISSTINGTTCICTVKIVDTTAPKLVLKSGRVFNDGVLTAEELVEETSDLSGAVTVRFVENPPFGTPGTHTVSIEATDIHGNVATAQTTLEIIEDTEAPVFSGLSTIYINKNGWFSFEEGVTAVDNIDGEVHYDYNIGNLNVEKAGTYFLNYFSNDAAGNTVHAKRKIVVNHDNSDTAALVASIARSLPNDPEKLRNYVRNNIYYNTNWGGDDPVWYGFTNHVGNCWVHALCLQELLNYYGWNNQIVGVSEEFSNHPHYWLVIEIQPGVWRHIDATPGRMHEKYSLMTDEQRFETLYLGGIDVQRDWDRTTCPPCV
jgi:hypothetical protein